eukprot:2467380-Prymnesium_polylepis.1
MWSGCRSSTLTLCAVQKLLAISSHSRKERQLNDVPYAAQNVAPGGAASGAGPQPPGMMVLQMRWAPGKASACFATLRSTFVKLPTP